ncbi:MAG: N-acetyltransferase [Sphingobacteriales bacterium]|nr:MAG: N-acetyltransferase [Sphingobacteriales bacterium]
MIFDSLETARLQLNLITPAVLHEVFRTLEKETLKKIMGFDEQAYESHLEMHRKGMETNRLSLLYFLLTDKKTGQPLGTCGFHTWNATHRRAELFYSLLSDEHKQKGLMTEALERAYWPMALIP